MADDRHGERASVVDEEEDVAPHTSPPAAGVRPSGTTSRLPPLRVVGQVNETYIVAEAPEGMYLIDQHAAHERVVYERLMRRRQSEAIGRQHLLLPVSVDVPPTAATLLIGHRELLSAWGFEVEEFGEGTLRVRSIPQGLHETQVGPALLEIAAHLDGERGATPQDRQEQITITVACHSSVRAGQVLSHEEMRQLLQQLERCAFPRTCPHGRPTVLLLSQAQLDRQFGRRG
jgi:DNA mismatch repair protein MutL